MSFNLDALDAGMLHVYKEVTWYRDMVITSTELFQQWAVDSQP